MSVSLSATLLEKLQTDCNEILQRGPVVVKGTSDLILAALRITMLTVQSEIRLNTQQIVSRF